MPGPKKEDIITFKVDTALYRTLRTIPNRSEFIRTAILTVLRETCPLCKGAGTLTLDQRRHWDTFADHHQIVECQNCRAAHLVCCANTAAGTPPHQSCRRVSDDTA